MSNSTMCAAEEFSWHLLLLVSFFLKCPYHGPSFLLFSSHLISSNLFSALLISTLLSALLISALDSSSHLSSWQLFSALLTSSQLRSALLNCSFLFECRHDGNFSPKHPFSTLYLCVVSCHALSRDFVHPCMLLYSLVTTFPSLRVRYRPQRSLDDTDSIFTQEINQRLIELLTHLLNCSSTLIVGLPFFKVFRPLEHYTPNSPSSFGTAKSSNLTSLGTCRQEVLRRLICT